MRGTYGGLALLLTLGACLAAAPRAYGDHNHNGNGSGNRNALSIRSPTHNHGLQIASNANAGGVSSIRTVFCRGQRVCHVHQTG